MWSQSNEEEWLMVGRRATFTRGTANRSVKSGNASVEITLMPLSSSYTKSTQAGTAHVYEDLSALIDDHSSVKT